MCVSRFRHRPGLVDAHGYRAGRIYRHFYDQRQGPASSSGNLLDSYLEFLLERGEYFQARDLLQASFRRSSSAKVDAIIELYDRWGRLDELPGAAAALDLTPGALVELNQLLSVKTKEKDSLSETPDRQ